MSHLPRLACNDYVWKTFYRRENRDWTGNLDQALAEIARSGFAGFEPNATSAEHVQELAPLLAKHDLSMHSIYVNSTLHTEEAVAHSIEQILAIAEAARTLNTHIVVTNPSPIRWGSDEAKTDEQLEIQAAALNRLGTALHARGLILAYHNHDPELRHAAREFHHMMLATDPDVVALCLDPHWIYRGAGNSQLALFDIVQLYGRRIVELHLRQSQHGIWSETFGAGDIDYPRLVRMLRQVGAEPHLVMEQAIEQGTPHTLDVVEAHRQGLAYAASLFTQNPA